MLGIIAVGLVILYGLDIFDQVAVMRLESLCESFGSREEHRGRMYVDHELGMKTIICVEGRTIDHRLVCIIVLEFCKRQEIRPIIMLIIAIDMKILFNGLIHMFNLIISLGVECCR